MELYGKAIKARQSGKLVSTSHLACPRIAVDPSRIESLDAEACSLEVPEWVTEPVLYPTRIRSPFGGAYKNLSRHIGGTPAGIECSRQCFRGISPVFSSQSF